MKSGAASRGTQWEASSIRSYLHSSVTKAEESLICLSVKAKSPVLQTPITGTRTGGSSGGGRRNRSGWALARYQLSDDVSAPGRESSAIQLSVSGWFPTNRRNIDQWSLDNSSSATSLNWNKSMYHDLIICSRRRPPNETG